MDEPTKGLPATVPTSEALQQIQVTVERLAMLYYHFARTMVDELGEEAGRDLIRKAIASYGQEVGERHRRKVEAAGHEPSCENFKALPDLPTMAWAPGAMPTILRDGKAIEVCPLAKYWMDRGAESLGRLYCGVDQAKYTAFDPECECRHLQNVLDGDDSCQTVARKRSEWERVDRESGD